MVGALEIVSKALSLMHWILNSYCTTNIVCSLR
jgi:hypothetical protein